MEQHTSGEEMLLLAIVAAWIALALLVGIPLGRHLKRIHAHYPPIDSETGNTEGDTEWRERWH